MRRFCQVPSLSVCLERAVAVVYNALMSPVKYALVLIAALLTIPACAPRALLKPLPADTPPDKVFEMVRAQEEGIKEIRASVNVSFKLDTGPVQDFDAVLYVAKPDKVRLTGLAVMGVTIFDVLLNGDKFYFYQPSDGYLYTGKRAALRGFLEGMGVKADPEVLYRCLFFENPSGPLDRYFYEKTDAGYVFYQVLDQGGVLVPRVKNEYDLGLDLKRKVFYDEHASPYLYVEPEGFTGQDGHRLPSWLIARDITNGYSITVTFEKYLINPEGMEGDFTIQGGEIKGIKEVE